MHTFLTERWGLEVPIIGAPMSPQAGGRLAAALSNAGALGMIGVSAGQSAEDLEGDIATGRGLAAVLAAGAVGAWIGTPLLVSEEARNSQAARQRLLDARETETVLTSIFDVAQNIPWPAQYGGRALKNSFAHRWVGHETDLAQDADAKRYLTAAKQAEDYETAYLYAGQTVGMLARIEPAADIVRRIATEAETCLRAVASTVAR